MVRSRWPPKSQNFKWLIQDGRQKKAGFQLVLTRWLPKSNIFDTYGQFLNAICKPSTLHHSKSSHVHISDPPLYLKHFNTLQVDVQYSNSLVFKLSGIQIGPFGIVRIKWLPKVTGQDWTFKYQTKNVQFSNGLDKMVADHKNTVGVRILNKFVIWMVGVCSVFLWGPRIKSATTYRVSLPWSANSFGKFVLFQISLVFRLLKPV